MTDDMLTYDMFWLASVVQNVEAGTSLIHS